AGFQSGVDSTPRLVWASLRTWAQSTAGNITGPAGLPLGGGLVAPLFLAALSAGSRAAGVARAGRASGRESDPDGVRSPGRNLSRASQLSPGVSNAVGFPDLQRRDPNHHQDGNGVRHRAGHRPERAD